MNRMRKFTYFSAIFALVTGISEAQTVFQADRATLQPNIKRDQNGFLTCGVRAIVLSSYGQNIEVYDFSVNADAGLFLGTLKAGKKVVSYADALQQNIPKDAVTPAPINFWISLEESGQPVTLKRIIASGDKGFILGVSDIVPAFEVMTAMITGKRIQFALRYKAQKYDNIIAFSAAPTDDEAKGLRACISGLIERMQKSTGREQ